MQEVGRAASLARYRNKKSLLDQNFPLRPKESVKLLTGHIVSHTCPVKTMSVILKRGSKVLTGMYEN